MEVGALKRDYHIIAAGYNSKTNLDYDFVNIDIHEKRKELTINFHLGYPILLKKVFSALIHIIYFNYFYKLKNQEKINERSEFNLLKKLSFDLVIVHHIWQLALAVKLARYKKVRLIFNAHEYYPLEFDDDANWMNTFHYKYTELCKKYLPKVDLCFCVGGIIAEKYKQEFNLESKIISNTKPYYTLKPQELKEGEKVKIIHHGAIIASRKIELMIDMMDYLGDNYHLTLILIPSGDLDYFENIQNKAFQHPRVSVIDAVSVSEIPLVLNRFDIGLFILPPTNYNYRNALPNKFFEFIQARLAIAISPSPEMAELVNKYDLGIVANDFSAKAMAEKINELSLEKIMYYKNQSHIYAKEFSDENTQQLIKLSVQKLI
jgi:glycosyltransferase involved in cell wall biosynthesis